MEMPLPGPTFDDGYQIILGSRHCGVGDDLGHVDVTLQVTLRGSFKKQCLSYLVTTSRDRRIGPCNQVEIECGRYEAVEVKKRGSGQLSTSPMPHLCAEMHERQFGK
jgi:hypothetical protein